MVIERDLIKLCKDIISILVRLEEEGLITKDELKEHLDKKLQFLNYSSGSYAAASNENISRYKDKTLNIWGFIF